MNYSIGLMNNKECNNFLLKKEVVGKIYKTIFGSATCLETKYVEFELDKLFEEMVKDVRDI